VEDDSIQQGSFFYDVLPTPMIYDEEKRNLSIDSLDFTPPFRSDVFKEDRYYE
jgi:hypothetical protein